MGCLTDGCPWLQANEPAAKDSTSSDATTGGVAQSQTEGRQGDRDKPFSAGDP